ncbi:hypothetical protein MASR2M47_37240 [Draconibacterium sp.]
MLVPIGTALSGFLISTNDMKTLLLISLLIAGSVLAQPQKPIGTGKIKPPCPNAKIVETEVKADYTEIEYLCDGISIEVGYDEKNNIIYTEREAKIPTDIQDKIKQKLDKRYEGWSFDESLLVEMPDTAFYKFELMKGGIEENVYFSFGREILQTRQYPNQRNMDRKESFVSK